MSLVVFAWLGVLAPATAKEQYIVGSDWPTYRHDAALSAISPLKGGLGQPPRVAWSIDLGGPRIPSESVLVRDVTGDGRDEILILGSDTVECRRRRRDAGSGCSRAIPTPSVVDVRDYAGDGSRGHPADDDASAAGSRPSWSTDGPGGRSSLWKDENNFGGHTRFGKLLPGVAGRRWPAPPAGKPRRSRTAGSIRLVSFENGLDRPHFRIRQSLPGDFYSPLMLFDDLDADGAVEMVVISHEALWTFDTENGRQEFTARYAPMIRTYYATDRLGEALARRPAALARHDQPAPARAQGGPAGRQVPGHEALEGRGGREGRPVPVGDPDRARAGRMSSPTSTATAGTRSLASITNEHGDRSQHLVVFDASTGRRLAEAGDERILSVDDLDGDGRPEVLLQGAGRLRLAHWDGRRLQRALAGRWRRAAPPAAPRRGSLSRTSGGNTPVWRESPGSDLFLLRFPDGVSACRLAGNQVVRVKPVATHEALGNTGDGRDPQAERVTWKGTPW